MDISGPSTTRPDTADTYNVTVARFLAGKNGQSSAEFLLDDPEALAKIREAAEATPVVDTFVRSRPEQSPGDLTEAFRMVLEEVLQDMVIERGPWQEIDDAISRSIMRMKNDAN